MENTEYKIWKTRSLTLNMENTECDIKNMENTESDVKNMKNTESDVMSAWNMENSERFSIIIKYYVMWCNLCKFERQIQIQYKPIDALLCFRCKTDLYNR